ncbi:Acetamidase [Drechslerella dactyloides]|uniref:amidase n=1 Tax=Drechslerella dactyloides TaxID=74499 RepID=A0AAD6IRW7_DREDA|nr:Acetamidase [Drechslerella dactyloides]
MASTLRVSIISLVLFLDCMVHANAEVPIWQKIAIERQQYRDASISRISPRIPDIKSANLPLNVLNKARSMLTRQEVKITEMSSTELLGLLASGKLTAVEVTNAFLRRAGVAQKLVNCITEVLPERAIATAKYLDEYYQKHGKPIGPFHGLPISVKEHLGMKGLTYDAGFCSKAKDISPDDHTLVKILSAAGAVFYARTTEPQSLMQFETDSNLYGPTVNPFNRNLTCGGSSGGEGALLGIRGSSLGIGSDIGGSIRVPSANNGSMAVVGGSDGIEGTPGPMSTTLEPLSLFMSTISAAEPWVNDKSMLPIPWRDEEPHFPVDPATGKPKKMRVGVMRWDGMVMPHPPITRAINEVVAKLKGHADQFEVVEFNDENYEEAMDAMWALLFADGGNEVREELKKTGEPIIPLTEYSLIQPGTPKSPGWTLQELWQKKGVKSKFQSQYSAKWRASGLDVLLCPVAPGVAGRLGTTKYGTYTALFNLLEYPAAVFPVSKVDETDNGIWDYKPREGFDKEFAMLWDANVYKDAPISLQLVARRFEDEKTTNLYDMANQLLSTRSDDSTRRVGKKWAGNFVKRRPELQTRLSRKYDYQRAKCEDPALISKWFQLVEAVKAKYGIADNDIYNFDETGFAMGMISTTTVVTGAESRDKAKLAQPGNREWATVIQGVGAEGWALPPFIILAGQYHLASWYTATKLPADWVIALSDNGWTTNELALQWLQHFDKFTAQRCYSDYRLLVLDGHESHHSAAFELYCQEHKIVTICMPPHSSHILQPLDIGCFGPLKQAYSKEVESLIRAHINHISKLEFLSGFHKAFTAAITPKNIRSSFAGAGIVPYNPDRVLSKLDIQLLAATPVNSRPGTANAEATWTTKTPLNPSEASLQAGLIKNQITQYQNTSPTSLLAAVDQLSKGAQTIMHQMALIRAENTTLRSANELLSKRRQLKRQRIQHGGTLTIHQADRILDGDAVDEVVEQPAPPKRQRTPQPEATSAHIRRCDYLLVWLTTAAAANYPSRGSLWLGVAPMVWTPYLLTLPTYSIIVQDFTSLVYAVNALWNPERNSSLLIWLTCARIKSSTWRLYACFNGPKHPMSNG